MNRSHFGTCLACIAAMTKLELPAYMNGNQPLDATLQSLVWCAGFAAGARVAEIGIGHDGVLCKAHLEAFDMYRKAFLTADAPLEIARGEENAVQVATDAEQVLAIIGSGR